MSIKTNKNHTTVLDIITVLIICLIAYVFLGLFGACILELTGYEALNLTYNFIFGFGVIAAAVFFGAVIEEIIGGNHV